MRRRRYFGTDGIRGVSNLEPMTVETATKVGRAVAYHFKNGPGRHKIVIGKDTRLSGYMFETAISAGIISMGGDVLLVGPLPTPGIAFITSSMRADAGIVISASHNPFYDNGIKIFGGDGFKLPDEVELHLEELMESPVLDEYRADPENIGRAFRIDDATGRYVVYLKNTFPRRRTLDGLSIVLDCAHGAGYRAAPAVFTELGAKVHTIGAEPDGLNINRDCGALHPERLAKEVMKRGANMGVALDGDGDRIIVVDEKGEELNGDHIIAICALDMLREKKLKKKAVVVTMMSNVGFEIAMESSGIKVIRTEVGDRYVLEQMRKGGYNLGGEQSGHIIFLDHSTTGDGILAGIQLLKVMVEQGKPLSELKRVVEMFPQVLVNVEVEEKIPLENLKDMTRVIKDSEKKMNGKGRIFVRYSGTEPLLRVMVEGMNMEEISRMAGEIAETASKEIRRRRA